MTSLLEWLLPEKQKRRQVAGFLAEHSWETHEHRDDACFFRCRWCGELRGLPYVEYDRQLDNFLANAPKAGCAGAGTSARAEVVALTPTLRPYI